METINNYLENMFKTLPDTDEVNQLKEDLYSNMEDKYNELKASGKSENEAIGIVISEFGNIDELTLELGLSKNTEKNLKDQDNSTRVISLKEAKVFIDDKKRYGLMVAIGVWLCIFAVNTLLAFRLIANTPEEAIGLIPLFIFIACAVGLFIYSGSKLNKYEYIKEEIFDLDNESYKYVKNLESSFQGKYIISVIVGVILCILSVIPILIFDKYNENLGVCILLFIVSIAVFIFVYFGNIRGAFKQLLQLDDYSKKNKENKIIGIVASIVFPITSFVYLLVSLFTGAWHITWIIWPVVGVLFGGFSSLYNEMHDKNNKKMI